MRPTQQLMTVAISTSDSPDMAALGLGEGHLKEAMAELALQLLAADISLAYGGDLRAHGFTQFLFRYGLAVYLHYRLKEHCESHQSLGMARSY